MPIGPGSFVAAIPRLLAVLAFLAFLPSCKRADPDPSDPSDLPPEEEQEAALETGRQAATALRTALLTQLQAAMASGDHAKAVEVCRVAAETVTKATAKQFEGVEIHRVTTRPRSPANAAGEADTAALEHLAAAPSGDQPAERLEWSATRFRYYQALRIMDRCLKCHGDPETFGEELRTLLAKSYPQDQAVGYRLGDFRGAIRVDIPRRAPAGPDH